MADTDGEGSTTLQPTDFLRVGHERLESTALIILNSPISDFEYFQRLYNHASFRVAADGGANRIHDLLTEHSPSLEWRDALRLGLPDLIHGDLDSLDGNVRRRYDSIGVEISEDSDQYSTDFGKAIKKVIERMPHARDILVLGSLGGRVDQGIGLLHELYREQRLRHTGVRFWLFSEASITTLLTPGSTRIHTPLSEGLVARSVGILPLFGPATISTKGLEWDVQDWPTEMGGQVSTSNYIVSDWLTVKTDREVIFTVERAAMTGRGASTK